jgi:diguanylate cyclase (GGDEF)-like protein
LSAGSRSWFVPADAENPQWRLFLRSDFGIDDWILIAMDAAPEPSGAAPLARLSALVAVCTLLFVGMLGLIQVRRTMVPLERLIAGTRRLSERDYGARVHVARRDEFGELAQSFNHMAERIDRQIEAMRMQSSIDHEILNGLNVARVLQRVAQRLELLGPGAMACVVKFDHASQLGRVHTARAPMAIIGVPRDDAATIARLPADETILCADPPSWLHAFVPHAGRLWLRCARADNKVLGLLAISAVDHAFDDIETRREVAELGDRVSVALSSADRERRLLERATRDGLTGLANRTGLYESIDRLLEAQPSAAFSLLFLDLDGFKEINDSLGHHVGDDLLRAVAERLRRCVPRGTLVARPGGDEFVVVLHGTRQAADELARRLCAELARPIDLAGRTAVVGGGVGIAHHPEDGSSAVDLMRRADMAMYSAKARGGGTASWFEPEMDQRMAERAALLADLRHARERGELQLNYQPRVDVRSRSVRSAEALLRWAHPTRGFVPTATFINLLEETGLIVDVGLWVLDQAVDQFVRWRGLGLALDCIAVNLSTRQLQDAELPSRVAEILDRHGVRPDSLELEVTESIFMGDATQAIGTLQRLSDSGVHIALDDFGTGYSSLSYLHKLPIGVIKVDRSFVFELGRRDSALALTRSIVALARALGLRVVAEGVETEQQVELLSGLGCDELQGWYYAPAMEPAAFIACVSRPLEIGATELS